MEAPMHTSTSHEATKSFDHDLVLSRHLSWEEEELNDPEKTQLADNDLDVHSDSDKISEYDTEHCPGVCVSTDDAPRAPTTRQANRQSHPLSLQSNVTHIQAEGVRAKVARSDAILEKISRQKMLVEEHATTQVVTRKQQKEVPKKAKAAKNTEVAKVVTHSRSHEQVPFCTHKVYWTQIPGRSRCEHHSYSPNSYRNPFRFKCPGCNTIACGLCMKKLKRGGMAK
ncbi:hypothetical protein P171DRAFT_437161 [Karstenula rhodostoma CBS 690.94]|uniref:Uncharacterized protein n=1 Tax=Karstenula rhodostoma CBS 690.94 TaxID=1392251 RepID=A0A9P4U5U4_9PLEO|nr:hypothetical protein P171DRAFT_437161 [Karstenula rhodostoma CBS 690.94]